MQQILHNTTKMWWITARQIGFHTRPSRIQNTFKITVPACCVNMKDNVPLTHTHTHIFVLQYWQSILNCLTPKCLIKKTWNSTIGNQLQAISRKLGAGHDHKLSLILNINLMLAYIISSSKFRKTWKYRSHNLFSLDNHSYCHLLSYSPQSCFVFHWLTRPEYLVGLRHSCWQFKWVFYL